MITNIRLLSQQLVNPDFENPKELVAWMGAIQAQDYKMAKWAVGIRSKSATLQTVDEALRRGDILRTHVMRPTWHLVAAEDIRWMLKLSAQHIKSASESFAKGRGLDIAESLYTKCNNLLERILEGNKSLTKQEIEVELNQAGIIADNSLMTRFLMRAEADGIVCSGIDKGNKHTYALLEERVPPVKELHKEEALARLAVKYFRSHSPASLQDFVWWSGLTVTEAKQAMGLIDVELREIQVGASTLFIHESCNTELKFDNVLHFLPAYDEYLISYKERMTVMNPVHYPKAFNAFGIFYPVILYNGKIVGNWSKSIKKDQTTVNTSFFDQDQHWNRELIKMAEDRYKVFLS